jgi:hypothetical protein
MKVKDLKEEAKALELEIFLMSKSIKTEDKKKLHRCQKELEKINRKIEKRT